MFCTVHTRGPPPQRGALRMPFSSADSYSGGVQFVGQAFCTAPPSGFQVTWFALTAVCGLAVTFFGCGGAVSCDARLVCATRLSPPMDGLRTHVAGAHRYKIFKGVVFVIGAALGAAACVFVLEYFNRKGRPCHDVLGM